MIVCWAVGAVGHCPPLPHFLEDQLTLSQPGGSGLLLAPRIFRPSYRTRADVLFIEDCRKWVEIENWEFSNLAL